MAEIAEMAEKSGKSGRIFFWLLFSLRFCISFSDSGVNFRLWQPLNESKFRQTHAGQLAVRGRASILAGSGRVKSGQSGQYSLIWSFALDFEHESSPSLLGAGQMD